MFCGTVCGFDGYATLYFSFVYTGTQYWFCLLLLLLSTKGVMVQAKIWFLKQHFEGFPKDTDLELKVEQLSEPKDGGL